MGDVLSMYSEVDLLVWGIWDPSVQTHEKHLGPTVKMPRYVCLDFETNGFPSRGARFGDWTLPFSSFPIQLSVDIVDADMEIVHAMDTTIRGATQLAPWVRANVPITLENIREGLPFEDVVRELAGLLQDGDTIVAHNVSFDLDTVLARTANKLGYSPPGLHRILEAPRFCTMRCAYSRAALGQPRLKELCRHFEVTLDGAHDARADSAALVRCVAEALRRGVML